MDIFVSLWQRTTDGNSETAKFSKFEDETNQVEVMMNNNNNNNSLENGEDSKRSSDKITTWEAGWNVTNAIQGMFVVSFPYAVRHGGIWAVVAIVVVAVVCCYTGEILVSCLYDAESIRDGTGVDGTGVDGTDVQEEEFDGGKNDRNGDHGSVDTARSGSVGSVDAARSGSVGVGLVRRRKSYVDIAVAVWGDYKGATLVNGAQIVELLMTCILYLVLCGDLLEDSFRWLQLRQSTWTACACACLVPCAFMSTLKSVSSTSFWCTVAHVVINVVILIFCVMRFNVWSWDQLTWHIDITTFPISLGIVVFSYTSQIFVSTLEGNLKDPSQFTAMMRWTHGTAAGAKALFGVVGFLTFGSSTREILTENLSATPTFKMLVDVCLVLKALLSYPLPFYQAAELMGESMPGWVRGRSDKSSSWPILSRLLLLVLTLTLAVYIPHFALLMGFVGSFTGTMLSFVWPCIFHIQLRRSTLPILNVVVDVVVIVVGVLCGAVGMFFSGEALVKALAEDD